MTRAIFWFFAVCSLSGCGSASQAPPNVQRDAMPSAQESERGISRYPYNAPFEQVAKIKAGLKTLALCMTKMQTKGLMGAPDFSEVDFGPKGPGEKWRGSNWVYYVSKHSERMNLNDSTVEVFFDTADRVQWIAPSRVEGAKELGSPEKKCI